MEREDIAYEIACERFDTDEPTCEQFREVEQQLWADEADDAIDAYRDELLSNESMGDL